MRQAEIMLDALTAMVDEIDQDIVRVMQRAVNVILEERGPEWLDDAWLAATMSGFRGVMRMVGVLYPTTRNGVLADRGGAQGRYSGHAGRTCSAAQ